MHIGIASAALASGMILAASHAAAAETTTSVDALIGTPAASLAEAFGQGATVVDAISFAPGGDVRLAAVSAPNVCFFDDGAGRRARLLLVLERAGRVAGVAPAVFVTIRDGRIGAVNRPVLAESHARLPLEDGADAMAARFEREAWPAGARITLRCASTPTRRQAPTMAETVASVPILAVGAVAFAPVILFGVPSENRSRRAAEIEGARIAGLLKPGAAVPGGVDDFVRRNNRWVRLVRDPGGDYAVLSVDLGGPAGNGIGQPREAVFFGVRGDRVEWRGSRDVGVEAAICGLADDRARRRPGCSTTGHYSPER